MRGSRVSSGLSALSYKRDFADPPMMNGVSVTDYPCSSSVRSLSFLRRAPKENARREHGHGNKKHGHGSKNHGHGRWNTEMK